MGWLIKQKSNYSKKSIHEYDLGPFCISTKIIVQLIKVCQIHIQGLPPTEGPLEHSNASI